MSWFLLYEQFMLKESADPEMDKLKAELRDTDPGSPERLEVLGKINKLNAQRRSQRSDRAVREDFQDSERSDNPIPDWKLKYKDPYYGTEMNGELNNYLGHAGQALKDKIIDTSPIDPNAIEGLSDNDKRKLEAFNREVADLRKRHKRSGYTEDFILMATWVLTGVWEMPKHPFTLSQGATWGHEFVDDLYNQGVLVRYKKGRQIWIRSAFTPEAQEKIKAYLEAKEKQFQYDNRGRISGRNYGIVEKKQ